MNKQDLLNFEAKMADLYRDSKLPFLFHLSGGNEDQLIEIFKEIKEGDYVLSTHRNHYHALLHGIPAAELEEKILGGRSMFVFDRKRNFFTSAIIGGTVAIAAGIALALKRKKSDQKVWCFIGDGTEDSGHLYEAARYVDGHDLPCTFIIEDNNRSVNTSKIQRWGKIENPIQWPKCVRKYYYDITWPHARTDDKIDLSKTKRFTDDEVFPNKCAMMLGSLSHEYVSSIPKSPNYLSYSSSVKMAMEILAANNSVFIGYNVLNGNAMGALSGVSNDLKIETPVAENLMSGLAIGMSFEGFKPVVYFERHDFMLVAADAIGNHMNHIYRASHGEYECPVIIRSIVADSGPFYSGITHSQDFTKVFQQLVSFPVWEPTCANSVLHDYLYNSNIPRMIVERKSCHV